MYSHRCSPGVPGGFFHRVKDGTWMGHVIEHIALEIQTLAGMETGFGRTRETKTSGIYNVVFSYVKDHFQEPISVDEISKLVSMTTPSFCRYFKKISNKTFTEFVNEYRLVHASKLLAEKPISINEVCYESGFNNFSHFSKSFKQYTGKSASEYRQEHRATIM